MTDASQHTPPSFAREGAIATIRLNRPRYHNRIEPADLGALQRLLDEVEGDRGARVLVLAATGPSFSSGYHLGSLSRDVDDEEAPSAFAALGERLETFPLPTICRLHGGVYGGATDLALACDFRVGTEAIGMFMPAARIGLHYHPDGLKRFVARLGPDAAKRLFLTGERLPASEMLRIGFLTELVPAERLDERIAELAATLAANAPRALRGIKRTINDIAAGRSDRAAAEARYRDSLRGAELQEGLRAVAEKRAAAFADPEPDV